MAFAMTSYGQNIIYSYTFDEGLEGWTTQGISSLEADKADSAIWVWTADGDASTGAYNGGAPIESESEGGAILFDSDGLDNGGVEGAFGEGKSPSPQKGEITSPSMDLTGQETVILAFNQFYRYFAKSGDDAVTPASTVEVSNDGGATWTPFVVNEGIPTNSSTRASDIQAIDISEVAANQADVQVKFVWDGDYYFWIIDDVRLFDDAGVDLAILDYTNINNYLTPDFALNTDSFDLEVMVTNNGNSITDSIQFIARILDENLDFVFGDTGWIEGMDSGDTLIWDFDRSWVPTDATQQEYAVVYNVRHQGDTMAEIITPDDNIDFNFFEVTDFTFKAVPESGRTQGYNFGGMEYDIANFIALPESLNEPIAVDKLAFRVCDGDEAITGKTVIGFIIELPDSARQEKGVLLTGETDLIGFDASIGLDDLFGSTDNEVIGIGSYLFKATDDASQCEEFFIDTLTNIDGDDADILLQPGGKYLIGLRFGPTASDLFVGTNEDYKLWQLTTIVSTPRDATSGWAIVTDYEENVAALGLELKLMSTATDENPLPETSVSVFPNPASDFIKVDVNFDRATDASIFLADANGKIISVKTPRNVKSDQFNFDMTRYPSGSYIVRIATEEGTRTQQVVVTH